MTELPAEPPPPPPAKQTREFCFNTHTHGFTFNLRIPTCKQRSRSKKGANDRHRSLNEYQSGRVIELTTLNVVFIRQLSIFSLSINLQAHFFYGRISFFNMKEILFFFLSSNVFLLDASVLCSKKRYIYIYIYLSFSLSASKAR